MGLNLNFFLMNPEITLTSSIWGKKRKYWFWVYISCIVIFYEFFFKQTDVTSSDFYKNYAIWCPTVKRQDVPCFNIDFQLHSYVSGKQLLFKIYNSYKHWSSTNSSFPVVWAQKLRHHLTFLPKSVCPLYTSHSTETHPFTNSHVKFSMFISN